jgi:DNA polymerase-3 subunit gamma/tau
MSLALARKYRPKRFADVAVQTHVSHTLRGAIARGRVAHGYLLCGPRGTGKTTLARVLAMALNCPVRLETAKRLDQESFAAGAMVVSARSLSNERLAAGGEPCGGCESCLRIWSGASSLDVVEIDAASNRGVDDARDLRERAMYAPSGESRWKVYIIDEAHMLTREAWNALLKILEEPPPRVVFVFCTTEPQKIAQFAAPVLSRLQRFDFKRIGAADIRARLETVLASESIATEPDALALIARAADGSMRDALSLTDQVLALGEGTITAEGVRSALGLVAEDEYLAIIDLIAEHRAGEIFATVGRLVDEGVDLGTFVAGFGEMLRALLAVSLEGSPGALSERTRAALEERKGRIASGDLLRMLNALAELEPRFRRSIQQQLLLETMLVRFALLDRTVSIEAVLQELPEPNSDAGSRAGEPPRSLGGGHRPVGRGGGTRTSAPEGAAGLPRLSDVVAVSSPPRAGMPTPSRAWTVVAAPPVERAEATPVARDVAIPAPPEVHATDLNAVVGAWDDVVAGVRRERPLIATLLEQALPTSANANGVLTLQVDASAAFDGLNAKMADTIAALRGYITGLQRIALRASEQASPATAAPRMTAETVKLETLASLKKRDPVLAAAIEALDLELAD